jgi:CheY-like chemotaxis protein
MNVLVADDDPIYRKLLSAHLLRWGHEAAVAHDGADAWRRIEGSTGSLFAILDWSMPGADGIELCRRVRLLPAGRIVYVMLLTARTAREDIIAGLEAGADDYLTKPFDPGELFARFQVGARMLRLQQSLADRVRELEAALASVSQLQGLLPMCCYCKCIRNDENYWEQVEHYIAAHSELQFSHGICPGCYDKIVAPQLQALRREERPAPANGAAP